MNDRPSGRPGVSVSGYEIDWFLFLSRTYIVTEMRSISTRNSHGILSYSPCFAASIES